MFKLKFKRAYLLTFLLVLALMLAACGNNDSDDNNDDTPSNDLTILENVTLQNRSSLRIEPSNSADQLFETVSGFAPHIAGRTADSAWLFLYYGEGQNWGYAWVEAGRTSLNAEQIGSLAEVNPNSLPPVPDNLTRNQQSQRPGFNVGDPAPTPSNY